MRINDMREVVGDYKKSGLLVAFPFCNGKCYKELGLDSSICQNNHIESIYKEVSTEFILRFFKNVNVDSLILGGREPFDSFDDILKLIIDFRLNFSDDIIIYTGYNKNELEDKIAILKKYNNIIIKFGRFKPKSNSIYSEILGVNLASDNQYAEQIS